MIEITEHRVRVAHLPPALSGLRVVQLSDLHRSRLTSDRLLRHAIAAANNLHPDLILLTGDFVTQDPADIEPCMKLLAPLHARLGRYAVLGNHDFTAGAQLVERALACAHIPVLDNRNLQLENGLWLVGLEDDRHGKPDAHRAFTGVPAEAPVLVLSHNPVGAELVADRDCLVFSGHTHGGQIHVPILTPRQLRRIGAKHYRAGWYDVGKARLYINRGMGRVGVPIRFRCRPEVSCFTLET